MEIVDTEEENAEIIYELAEVYFYSGNLERATCYIDGLLEANPNHPEALKLKIKLLGNEPRKRILIAKRLYDVTQKSEDLKLYLALLNKACDYESVAAFLKLPIADYCCQEIAESLYNLARYDEARELLQRQTELTEMNELLLAKICYQINDADSLKFLETKLIHSRNPEVVKFIIKLEYELMNYSKVIELSEKVSLIASPEALYHIGQAYLFKNSTLNAKKIFNLLVDKVTSPKNLFALGLSYVQAGQTTQAIEAVKNNTNYLKLMTLILNENSVSQKVLAKEFMSLADIFCQDELALFKVIEICFKHNLLKVVEGLLKFAENAKNIRYRFYEIKLMIRNKDFVEANALVNNYRDNDAFAMLYAELLDLQNDFKRLESHLDKLQNYEKDEFEQCCYYYARIFESKGEYERAIDVAEKGLDFVNNYSEMYYTLLYGLYKHIGDTRTAIECLEKASKFNPELRPKLIREAAEL